MDSGVTCSWSVFDGVKTIPETPEALMAATNAAIDAFECAQATSFLKSSSPFSSNNYEISDLDMKCLYDVQIADQAFRAGCAALAARKLDEALHCLNLSLSKCPPHQIAAIAKLQSLISLTSQQLHKSSSG